MMGQNANYHLCIKGLLPHILIRTNYEGLGKVVDACEIFSNFEVVGWVRGCGRIFNFVPNLLMVCRRHGYHNIPLQLRAIARSWTISVPMCMSERLFRYNEM